MEGFIDRRKAKRVTDLLDLPIITSSGLLSIFYDGAVYQAVLKTEIEPCLCKGLLKCLYVDGEKAMLDVQSADGLEYHCPLDKTLQLPIEPKLGITIITPVYQINTLKSFAKRFKLYGITTDKEFEDLIGINLHAPDLSFCRRVAGMKPENLSSDDIWRILHQEYLVTDEKQECIMIKGSSECIAYTTRSIPCENERYSQLAALKPIKRQIHFTSNPPWSSTSPINLALLIRSYNSYLGYEVMPGFHPGPDGQQVHKSRDDILTFDVYMIHLMDRKRSAIFQKVHDNGVYEIVRLRNAPPHGFVIQNKRVDAIIHSVTYARCETAKHVAMNPDSNVNSPTMPKQPSPLDMLTSPCASVSSSSSSSAK